MKVILLSLVLLLQTAAGQLVPDDIVALQLGPDMGPTYAGGMDFDKSSNSVYLTGATYGEFSEPGIGASKSSMCFFARFDLPGLELIQRSKYGLGHEMDACTAILSNPFNEQRNAIVVGTTETGGLLTKFAEGNDYIQYGFAMDLTYKQQFEFIGGSTVDGKHPVTYPVAIAANRDEFWTLSMVSSNTKVNPDFEKVSSREFPNFTNGGVIKYGSDYSFTVNAFRYSRPEGSDENNALEGLGAAQTFQEEWTYTIRNNQIHDSKHVDGLMVNGLLDTGNHLWVLGNVHHRGKMEGFLGWVRKRDRRLKDHHYFSIPRNAGTWIMGGCNHLHSGDAGHYYVVGATGKKSGETNSVHAFVARMHKGDAVWVTQFDVVTKDAEDIQVAASAYGCHVDIEDHFVYVAGTVENGARMADARQGSEPTQSAGGDDIFVAQLSTINGKLHWLKQIGSNGDDRVARSGAIKADKAGNAIVYGDTTGDMFRKREGIDMSARHSDLFIMMLEKTSGSHQSPLIGPRLNLNRGAPSEFFNLFMFTENEKKAGAIAGYSLLGVLVMATIIYYSRRRGHCRRSTRSSKTPINIYDAAAANLGYADDTPSSGSDGLFRRKGNDAHWAGTNLTSYKDDPDTAANSSGNFHKSYSDLAQKGKEIV